MSSSRVKHLILLIPCATALLLGLATQSAAADWPAISPEEKAVTSVPQQPDAPAVIFYREETTDDTKNFRTVYVRMKVLTEAGRKYADVEIPLGRNPFTISELSGRTVHSDGRIIPLEDQPVDKVVVRDHGLRVHVKAVTLSSVEVGSILDYRYSLHFPEDSRNAPEWIVQSELFERKVVFKFVPTKYQPKIDSLRNGAQDFEIIGNSIGGESVGEYGWVDNLPAGNKPQEQVTPEALAKWVDLEMSNVPALMREPDMPPAHNRCWQVDFFYRKQTNAGDSWKTVGKAWNQSVEKFLQRKAGVAEAVNQIVVASDTPEIKVRKIYAAVSRMKNQSDLATQTAAPNAGAENVLQKRSGTHDELNRLFVAMVRETGSPAKLTWVPDRARAIFSPDFMSTDQFDAEIAIVQLGGQEVFLDPATRFCPYGVLNWHYAGSRGLRQSSDNGAELAQTPAPIYQQAIIERVARLQLTEKGTMEGTLAVGFSGQEAMVRRQAGAALDEGSRRKLLEGEVRGWLPSGSEVSLTNMPEWDKTESTLVAKFKVNGPLATNQGQQWAFPPHVFEANEKPRLPSGPRTSPVYFDYASRQVDEVHIILPAAAEVETLPPNDQVKTSFSLYGTEQKREGRNGIVATRDLAMNGVLFTPAEYKDIKDFYDKVATGDHQPITLKSSFQTHNN